MIKNLKFVTKMTRMSFIIKQSNTEHKLICAEIGVWIGENAQDMLTIDKEMELYAIDAYVNIGVTDDTSQGSPDEVKAKAYNRLSVFGDRVKFVYKQSEDAYKDYPDGFFDYVYIDGDHDYKSVKRDIELWYPKVKAGGMLAGHDIIMDSVKTAVTEFLLENKIKKAAQLAIIPESDWWIFK